MAAQTALDLITASLKRLGAISGIETPSADLAQDALARLNDLIETWSTESLSLWSQVALGGGVMLAPLPPTLIAYTIGPGGDLDLPIRPAWIDSVSWSLPGSPPIEYKLTAFLQKEWEYERVKLLPSVQSTHYYYQAEWPLGQLALWPRPSIAFSLLVWIPQPLNGTATLATVLSLPPGYSRALRDCLALELAPEVGRQIDPALAQSAIDAKSQLQRVNFRSRVLQMPAGIATGNTAGYDWRIE